jgi:two-component system, NarL family, nitrate/nitrite response regulator NarL
MLNGHVSKLSANRSRRALLNEAEESHFLRLRLVLVSNVRLYLEGFACVLSRRRDVEIVEAITPDDKTIDEIADADYSAMLLDIGMPAALQFARDCVRAAPRTKVVALAASGSDNEFIACAESGISGFVPPNGLADDVINSVRGALCGEFTCSPRLAAILLSRMAVQTSSSQDPCERQMLTTREYEIVRLVRYGQSNKEIARALQISPATVKNHIHSILKKVQVKRRGQLALHANNSDSSAIKLTPSMGLKPHVTTANGCDYL